MTQNEKSVEKLAEMSAIFLKLNEKGQDSALTILRALDFAQAVMCREETLEADGQTK